MATQNSQTTLNGRIAATKPSKDQKVRVACAYTLAKTQLPGAPTRIIVEAASNLLLNSTPVLKAMLKQTAINAHYTRLAEQASEVKKNEMNDLLDAPASLSKEKKSVESELKGEAKNAADDRKDAGPQPSDYKDDGRKEPEGMEASKSEKRPAGTINMSEDIKVARTKKACRCGGKTKGCVGCKKAAEENAKAEEAPKSEEAPKDKAPEGDKEPKDDAPAEDSFPAEDESDMDAPEDGAGEDEAMFDPAKQDVQDAIEDVKADIDHLEEVLTDGEGLDETDNIDDLLSDETEDAEGDEFGDEQLDGQPDDLGFEDEDGGEGEELNFDQMFGDDNMDSKLSSLANEDGIEAGFDDAFGDDGGDLFGFNPSDAADLESVLDQEDKIMSTADMFELPGEGSDPMAALFASYKQAGDVVAPGDLVDLFQTDIKGSDDRDFETDHDGDLLAEVADHFDPRKRTETRDQTSTLKTPEKTAKKTAGIRTLNPGKGQRTASTKRVDLAALLFGND